MKRFKFISAFMAVILLLGALFVPAANPVYADLTNPVAPSDTPDPVGVTVAGNVVSPTVSVTVPSSASVFINPYAMTIYPNPASSENPVPETTAQVISPLYAMKNNTPTALKVYAEITGTLGGNATLVQDASQINSADTKNDAFVYVKFYEYNVPSATTNALGVAGEPKKEDLTIISPTDADNAYDATDVSTVLLTTRASQTNDPVLTTTALTKSNDATDIQTWGTKYVPNYICFRFLGIANGNAKVPWTNQDKIGATISWTFIPTA